MPRITVLCCRGQVDTLRGTLHQITGAGSLDGLRRARWDFRVVRWSHRMPGNGIGGGVNFPPGGDSVDHLLWPCPRKSHTKDTE